MHRHCLGLTLGMLSSMLLAVPLAQAQDEIPAKQLAGPPAEFEIMAVPDPAQSAIHSKNALLFVNLDSPGSKSNNWSAAIPLESPKMRVLVFSGGDSSWNLSMTSPSGVARGAATLATEQQRTEFGIGGSSFPVDLYAFDNLQTGKWTLSIDASAASARGGFILVEGDASTELSSHLADRNQLIGEQISVVARLSSNSLTERVVDADPATTISSAQLQVTAPDRSVRVIAMYDDGEHGDNAAGDGWFGGQFKPAAAGDYLAQVLVHGRDARGFDVLRTAEHVIPVIEDSLNLVHVDVVNSKSVSDDRVSIDLGVDAAKAQQHYRAYAEVWGTGRNGLTVPVSWIGGMVEPVRGAISLGFDTRWVTLAGASAPFELRNLRIEDPDHYIVVAEAKSLPLQLPAVREKSTEEIIVDEQMTMGPRPVGMAAAKGVGTRLILVHGYCSGGVWPAAQFGNASTFADTNQNRSNDTFARLILNFGATWNSFGTVAHSQGGMASLHLYNYYWSGLDYATGPRLMQSVGTPYRGTNIAGILATLGNWFGVGCGSNSDLTYSGAQSWLAGISTASRAKVNYYTTSFRLTNWWTNDYCNFATDLVLSDPEDGTVERSNGQLSSGINRGHTTGQCHTTGMRDPAQYHDSGRNATMNANAAR